MCRGHAQYSVFVPDSSKVTAGFLGFFVSFVTTCPYCACTQLFLVSYSFFVFHCSRRGVSTCKCCSIAAKDPRSQLVSNLHSDSASHSVTQTLFDPWTVAHQAHFCMGSWRRQWHPTPVLLPGKSHGWRSLVGHSSWGCKESDTTEQLHFHFSLSCIGKGNGNPPQCSCLENPRDWGAWWSAIYGVAQSRTRLK